MIDHGFPVNKYNPHCWIIGEPKIGKDVWIGAFTLIDGSGGLTIGKGCNISSGVHILTHDTVRRCISEGKYDKIDRKPVTIGEHTFIGTNAVIVMGVSIGSHCVIGAGSVVTRDVPDGVTVVGNPARIIRGKL